MCGIVGLAGRYSANEAAEIADRMNRAIVHRGPDDEGVWSTDGFAFAMRRLSIIDLKGGHQPMWTDDGVGIVFNGEIYNYRALRLELEDAGYQFKSHSDTEVVLYLYHRDGLSMISRLEGMFAICLYDPRTRHIHLLRDRFGVKPLYYGMVDGTFWFASEIKAMLAVISKRPSLNLQAIHDYLTLRFVPSPETVWLGIKKLKPGHFLTYALDGGKDLEIESYWQLQYQAQPLDQGRNYSAEFAQLFLGSVEKRLLAADVPVGVLLSGGLDSSAVSAAAVELGHRDFHTFSVAFDAGDEFDETNYAREVATHLGSHHHEVHISLKQFIDFLPQLVYATDEPLADLACVPLYFVSKLARQDVKVVLSGEGSDELLAGYNFERVGKLLAWLRSVEGWTPAMLRKCLGSLPTKGGSADWLALWGAHGWEGMLAARPYHMTQHWSELEKAVLWRGSPALKSSVAKIQEWYAEAGDRHPIDQLQQIYSGQWLTEDLLMKADKMSMATSLEVREPFLDHELAEWAAGLPLEWRIGSPQVGYSSKRILRDFCASRLPHSILHRPKRGFPVPAYQWLAGPLKSWAEDLLFAADSKLSSIFLPGEMRPVFSRAVAGDIASAHKIWILIILEFWLRAWQ